MAMTKCKECGAQISSSAKVCPQCGAPAPKKTSVFTWLVLGLIVAGVGISMTGPDAPPTPAKTPEQLAAEQREQDEFLQVLAVAKLVKSRAKNPDSFKLTYAGYTEKGAVCIEYRAANSFNALVPGVYIVAGQANGATSELWNRHCAGKPLRNYSHVRTVL